MKQKTTIFALAVFLFDGLGLCFVDVSTGELYLTEFSENYDEKAVDELARFMPSEILMNKETSTLKKILYLCQQKDGGHRRNIIIIRIRL